MSTDGRTRAERLARQVEFLRRPYKADRELHVVRHFLEALGLAGTLEEGPDPPDVLCHVGGSSLARFEVKVILDPNRLMQKEYKDALQQAQLADKRGALTPEPPDGECPRWTTDGVSPASYKPMTPSEIGELCLDWMQQRAGKYAEDQRSQMDLLLYVNLLDTFVEPGPMPNSTPLQRLGFRSVSAFMPPAAFVFAAKQDAPVVLGGRSGQAFGCDL